MPVPTATGASYYGNMPVIRSAKHADFAELTAIWRAAVERTHDFVSAEQIDAWEPKVRNEYLPGLQVWAVESDGGALIGFAGLDGTKMEMLFVSPQAHGQGIGRSLVEFLAERLGPLAVDVNEQNPGACTFYRRVGFRQTGRSETDPDGNPFPILHLAQEGFSA